MRRAFQLAAPYRTHPNPRVGAIVLDPNGNVIGEGFHRGPGHPHAEAMALARAGLVTSTRGTYGGYRLARPPHAISAADVIDALEGPVSITECSSSQSQCEHEGICSVGGTWQRINVAIRNALDEVTLVDLLHTNCSLPSFTFAGVPVSVERQRVKKSGNRPAG